MNRNNGHCVMPQNAVGCVKLQVCIHAHECVCMCVLVWNKHKTAAQTTKLTVISRKRKIEQCCMNAWHMCAVYGVARLRKKQKKNYQRHFLTEKYNLFEKLLKYCELNLLFQQIKFHAIIFTTRKTLASCCSHH